MAPGHSRASGFEEEGLVTVPNMSWSPGRAQGSGLRRSLVSGNFRAVAMAVWVEGRGREVKGWWDMRKSRGLVYKSFKKFGSGEKEEVLAQGRGYREDGKRYFVLFGLSGISTCL